MFFRRLLPPVLAVAALILITVPASAQNPGTRPASTGDGGRTAPFDPEALFDQTYLTSPVPATRSPTGRPGPDYWQNRADYRIAVELDTARHRVAGSETITYTNRSPHALQQLWMLLPLNRFAPEARSTKATGSPRASPTRFEIEAVRIDRGEGDRPVDPEITDTRMRIPLEEPLPASGGTLRIHVEFAFQVPTQGRLGRMESAHGPIYEISMWYPRMAVFDDVRGWNTLPFLGTGEFYLEFGTFEFAVTVPRSYLVVGSGTLQNPQTVLTERQRERLDRARSSPETVPVRTRSEVGDPATRPDGEGPLTWRFRMEETRDVAWAASPAFVWDAAAAELPSGETVLAQSAYPPSSLDEGGWERSTRFVRRSVEIFSEQWYPYPYENAIAVGGPVGGMEWPGIVFNHHQASGYLLFLLASHEVGHTWFPMLVGTNERRHAWMDEGFDTFIDIFAHERFNDGEFAPKRDGEYAPQGSNPAREIVDYMTRPRAQPILTRADLIPDQWYHHLQYYKPALGLTMLREEVLGPERFDAAFRAFIDRWAYRHPQPEDFFRTIEDVSGEDLTWFWRGWFARNWKLDQAVHGVSYENGDPAEGARITLANRYRFAMPTTVRIVEHDGDTARRSFPVEIWQRGGRYTFAHGSDSPLDTVVVDPDRTLPDAVPQNNRWTSP